MYYWNVITVIFLFSYYNVVTSQDSCASRTTCSDCIRHPSICVWCATNKNDFNKKRCKANSSYTQDWCPDNLQVPITIVKPSKDENFSYDLNHVTQIKPQQFYIKLRPGKSEEFKFSFQAASDFPVDLYFLLDASMTMLQIKNTTAKQSKNIYNTIKNMTKNVYLGFGTFIDKCAVPFSYFRYDSETTYSFRHWLPLTDNFTKFQEIVTKTDNGANRDEQEGGLDALAQVLACKDLIGWRNESRKIIVFVTDDPYHAAGDGKLAGIFQPYDGRCYTFDKAYTKELEMDYPSVGMINKLAVERSATILFYVEDEVKDIYKQLSGVISGSKVSTYTEDNRITAADDDIVNILKGIYINITRQINFKVQVKTARRKNVEISFKPDCTSGNKDKDCSVEIGKEKQFVGLVKLLEYAGQDKITVNIVIESVGEKLTLEIDVIKDCECEKGGELNSIFCHGEKRVCGICDCGERRYGSTCACVKSGRRNVFNDNSTCIPEGSNVTCSGHGACICGGCVCNDGFSGTFCDCNRKNCPRNNKELCSGDNHGECFCGKCVCKIGWKGEACECPDYDCKENGIVCSNRGRCGCKGCECDEIAPWDARNEYNKENCKMISSTKLHNLQCGKLKICSLCLLEQEDECTSCDDKIKSSVIQTLPEEYLNSTIWHVCYVNVDIGCHFTFVYFYDDENYQIEMKVQKDKNCAETYYIFGGTCLVTLIIIGIITLVAWKFLTDARDRREYLQFVSKTNDPENKNINPLYQPPMSSFQNPGFGKRSFR